MRPSVRRDPDRAAGGSPACRVQASGPGVIGGLLLSATPGILGSLVADLRGRGVEPALVGRVLQGPPGRIRVRRLPPG